MSTIQRIHWLLASSEVLDLYTDHHNLIFLFNPLAVQPDLSQNIVCKVRRRALRKSEYNYTCIQIYSFDNIWAALLS